MELASFFASSLVANKDCSLQIVFDNAHTHSKPSPPPRIREPKRLCRWDSSLSKKENMVLNSGWPRRTSDSLSDKGSPYLLEEDQCTGAKTCSDDIFFEVRVTKLSTRFDNSCSELSAFSEGSRDSNEPPRMPHRNGDYFPEADEREK